MAPTTPLCAPEAATAPIGFGDQNGGSGERLSAGQ